MCLAQEPQRSDAGEARTRDPSVSSQALYHWAIALPMLLLLRLLQGMYNGASRRYRDGKWYDK